MLSLCSLRVVSCKAIKRDGAKGLGTLYSVPCFSALIRSVEFCFGGCVEVIRVRKAEEASVT